MWLTCSYVLSINKFFEPGILVSGISTVWEDTDGSAKKCRCNLAINWITGLSSSYVFILVRAINVTCHGNNVFGGFNEMGKFYLKEQTELIGKLASDDTPKIEMLSSASKDVHIKFPDQCIHIIYHKEGINGLKGSTKIQKRQSIFKYKWHI